MLFLLLLSCGLGQAQSGKKKQTLETANLVFTKKENIQKQFIKTHFTEKEGLSNRSCYDVLKDSRGYLWITTRDGLNRYDGEEFIVYRHSIADTNSIDWNKLFFVTEDKYGKIWVSHDHLQTNIFDPETGVFRGFDKENEFFEPREGEHCIPKPFAFAIPELLKFLEDSADRNKKVNRRIAHHAGGMGEGNGDDDLILGYYNGQRYFWRMCNVGSGFGYCLYNIDENKWSHFTVQEKMDVNERLFWYPTHQAESLNNMLDSIDINFQEVIRVRIDNNKNFWILSTEDNQLSQFDITKKTLRRFGTNKDVNFSVYQDEDAAVWLTGKSGLTKIDTIPPLFGRLDLELQSINIIQLEDDYIYTNSEDYLVKINPTTYEAVPIFFNGLVDLYGNSANPRIFNLSSPNGKDIWSSHLDWPVGITTLNPETQDYDSYSALGYPTQTMVWVDEKEIWVDMYDKKELDYPGKGTHVFNIDSLSYLPQPQSFEHLYFEYALLDSTQNCVWAARKHYLLKINRSSYQIDTFSILKNEVSELTHLYLEDNSLWLATDVGLIEVDNRNLQVLRHVTTTEGLPSNNIRSIIKTGEILCLGTQNGLSLYNTQNQSIRNYFAEDGLSHNEFLTRSIFKDRNGMIWIGALDRINYFSPEKLLAEPRIKKPLVFTRQTVFNTEKDTFEEKIFFSKDTIMHFEIQPTDQSFTQYFALLNFKNSDRNQYSWYLEGYEKPWKNKGFKPVAHYQNLPPGKYNLRVKAYDHRGTPAQNTLDMSIVVLQVWYKRWWACLVYILVGLWGLYLFYRFKMRRQFEQQEAQRLVAEKKLLEEKNRQIAIEKQKAEEQQERAEHSERAKQQFLATMSHEIRTPMHAISGMTKILKRSNRLPPQEAYLDAIHQSSDNLLVILNDILDMSKIEAGKLDIETISMNPYILMQNVVDILKFKAQEKGISLSSHIQEDFPTQIMGDPTRLTQILINLVGNAIKFTENGNVHISLKQLTSQEASMLQFSVEDTGIGIPTEKLDAIFGSFEQVEEATTRKYGGTGLGLSICKQLVALQDGHIWVESTLGKGSTFSFTLPLVIAEGVERAVAKMTDTELRVIGAKLKDIKILIVEDNEFNRMIAQDDLLYYLPQTRIDSVENGKSAISKWQNNTYDLILMDIHMPEMGGLEATKRIRQLEQRSVHPHQAIPIIAMTASLLKTEIQSCYDAGMNNFIPKPYQAEELVLRIEEAITK